MNQNFLEEYQTSISPKLCEIDILLKTWEENVHIDIVSDILSISNEEICKLLRNNYKYIDKQSFLQLMKNGSSELCSLYRREIECGSPQIYSDKDISYIYDIPLKDVKDSCEMLGIKLITQSMIPIIFSNIKK